jgi:Tol biopolymer transport system component
LVAGLAILLLGPPSSTAASDEPLLGAVRQLTFEGRASGKARFSADGRTIIFESAREAGNPASQVYLLNLGNGELRRVLSDVSA